jgi:hypothetical protein
VVCILNVIFVLLTKFKYMFFVVIVKHDLNISKNI